ncbi:MAG: hypothetical protein ABW175_03535, partial [Bradyrhizobium sp.]
MPSIHSLAAMIRAGARTISTDDAGFYFGEVAIDTGFTMHGISPLIQGAACDGVTVLYTDLTPSAVTSGSSSSAGTLLTNYIIDGAPLGGVPANANGQFDIVIRYTGDAAYASYFQAAAVRWTQIITADIGDSIYGPDGTPVDDLLIDATVDVIDGPGSGGRNILGQAGPDYVRLPSYLPIHGVMKFDSY